MAGPKEEWLIWNEECRRHIKLLYQRLDSIPERPDLEPLSVKIKDIIASYSELQNNDDALRDRVYRLEQETNEQDQLTAVKSQDQEQLKKRFEIQENEFRNVLSAMERMRTTYDSEREQSQREMKDLKDLVDSFINDGHGNTFRTRHRG